MAMNTVRSFSEDGKMKYSAEGGNEWLLMPQDKGDGGRFRTSREMRKQQPPVIGC